MRHENGYPRPGAGRTVWMRGWAVPVRTRTRPCALPRSSLHTNACHALRGVDHARLLRHLRTGAPMTCARTGVAHRFRPGAGAGAPRPPRGCVGACRDRRRIGHFLYMDQASLICFGRQNARRESGVQLRGLNGSCRVLARTATTPRIRRGRRSCRRRTSADAASRAAFVAVRAARRIGVGGWPSPDVRVRRAGP